VADLKGEERESLEDEMRSWQLVLSTNERRFGGEEGPAFSQPEVRVLRTVGVDSKGGIFA